MEKQNKPIVLEDFDNLADAVLMRRLEHLTYYSKNVNIYTERERVVEKPGQWKFQFVVTRPGKDTASEDVVDMVVAHYDALDAEFESLKTKWILDYDKAL